jgi:hypothetical protein
MDGGTRFDEVAGAPAPGCREESAPSSRATESINKERWRVVTDFAQPNPSQGLENLKRADGHSPEDRQ